MKRAKKIVLTLSSFAALSLFSGCAMMEEGEQDDIDSLQQVDDVGTDPYGAKTFVCHQTADRTAPAHTVEISLSALAAHLGHGDVVGVCPASCVPSPEICGDTIDNDCDGAVDETCPPPPPFCTPGSTVSCYGGPGGTQGVGICASGVQVCNADGTAYGACTGEVRPAEEVCGDSLDNNCDGAVDPGCCVAEPERCGDNIDNSCDGVADEGCLGDHVWFDDGNGVQDDGEAPSVGTALTLRNASGAVVATTTTDISGNYYFSGVAPGTYTITVEPPPGFRPVDQGAGSDDRFDSDFDISDNITGNITVGTDGPDYDIDCGFVENIIG